MEDAAGDGLLKTRVEVLKSQTSVSRLPDLSSDAHGRSHDTAAINFKMRLPI